MEVNVIIFSSSLASCSKIGLWTEAGCLLEEMAQFGVSSSAWTWNPTITACGRGLHWQHAVATLAPEILHHTSLYSNTFNAVISALATSRVWYASLDSFSAMETLRDLAIFDMVSCSMQGVRVCSVLNANPPPSGVSCRGVAPDMTTYTSIADSVGSNLYWTRALQLFHQHVQSGLRMDAASVNAAPSAFICTVCLYM